MNNIDGAELDPNEFHKTNDMAQVTYLKVRGFDAQAMSWEGQTCYWAFRVSDSLLDTIDEFTAGDALVEPREYNRMFSQTKREFYDSKEQARR